MKTVLNILLLAILPLVTALHADTIYKITDEQGNITYTTTPPVNDTKTSTIDVAPEPSDERVKAAQERHKQNLRAGEIIDETNAERNRIAEENRIKKERQNQMQQNKHNEEDKDNQHYGYPYYPRHKPGYPVVRPPVNRPARPAR